MEDQTKKDASPHSLGRQGAHMFSSHASTNTPIDSRASSDHASRSCGQRSSLAARVSTPDRHIAPATFPDRAEFPPIESLYNSYPWGPPRSCYATDTSRSQLDSADEDSTYFADEYQVILDSILGAADYESRSHVFRDHPRGQRLNDAETNSTDYQEVAGDGRIKMMPANLISDSPSPTIYPFLRSDQLQHRHASGLDVPIRFPSAEFQRFTAREMFDASSVTCSKAYATGGAVNRDPNCTPLLSPATSYRSRPASEPEATFRDHGLAERHLVSSNLYSKSVPAEHLPFLMEAVGQLSADADSTLPGNHRARLEKDPVTEYPQFGGTYRSPYSLLPWKSTEGAPLASTLTGCFSSSQHHNYPTPPSSDHTPPLIRTINGVSFPNQYSLFSFSPDTAPTAARTLLSPPKTPISDSSLDTRAGWWDQIPSHPSDDSNLQPQQYTTPHPTSKTIPSTGLSGNCSANKMSVSLPDTAQIPTTTVDFPSNNEFTPPAPGSIQCDDCQKTFTGNRANQMRSLKRHTETDHHGIAYECMLCNERVSRSDYRIRHLESKKHYFRFPPTPKSRKRGHEMEQFLGDHFRKVAITKAEG